MNDASTWQVLYRSDEIADARSVATTIAAMEFDVRWNGAGADDDPPPGPFVVEVRTGDHPDLVGVLDAIIEEQAQFDRRFEHRRQMRDAIIFAGLILLTIVPLVLTLLAHLAEFGGRHRDTPGPLDTEHSRLEFASVRA